MSRRSLRLHMPPPYGDTSPLDHSLHYGSASFSAGVTSRRETKLLKSKRSQQHSVSCSQSLLQTPRKQSSLPLHNSSLHSAASDASLLSSLLDESSIQDRTLVDSFWGLDQDADPKDITVMSERSLALANSTLISPGEDHCPNHPAQIQTSMVNGYYCNDCALQSDREEVLTATHSPSKYAVSSAKASRLLHYQVPNQEPTVGATILLPSTIHCRDKSHKAKTGLCVSTWALVTSVCRRSLAWLALLITLLYKRILFRKDQYNTGVLKSMRDSSLLFYRRTAASIVTALTLTLQFSKRLGMQAWKAALLCWKGWRKVQADEINGKLVSRAYSRSCGNVNLDECGAYNKCLNLSGSLCDDCKGKQQSEMPTVTSTSSLSSWSSVACYLLRLLWSVTTFAGSCSFQLARRAGAAGWAVTKNLLQDLWSTGHSPGKAVSDVFWCLERGWYYTTTFMSLLSCFLLNRCLPNLFRCALILVLLLFLCSVLGWWDPSDLLSSLTAVSATDWQAGIPGLSFILNLTSTWRWLTPPREESGDVQTYTPAPHVLPLTQEALIEGAQSPDSARLLRLERGLSQLWQRVEAGGRRAEQQHSVLLRLHEELGRRLHEEAPGDSEESRLRATLEERLSELRAQLVEDRTRREQTQKQFLVQQQSQASRLAQLELLLQAVAAKMEHVQQRQEAAMTLPVPSTTTLPVSDSVGVDRDSYDALVAEVAQLGVALGSVRQDLEGLSRCQDNAHETISARVSTQVHEELHALLYGNQLANVSPPDSLLQWLTESYVSKADLRAALASLEHGILKNISLQVEQPSEPQPSSVEAAQNELHSTGAAVTQEQVQLMVKSALRLYSQDRTGLADYALESGGGSILSTRCSETYETKTALLSLFGLPLWYFSQSPRVVIQPDIHPGNCWAFKGSHGYLVIRLSMAIVPTAFSLEHIPKALAPTGTLRSAPRDFTIYGLDNEGHEKGKLLGSYRYEEDGEAVQTYPVSEENEQRYQIIEVRILSNWGHQDYTCLYRVRVHGSPSNN